MRNIVRLSVIALILFITSAWTWPWEEKAKTPASQPAASQTSAAVTPAESLKEIKDVSEKKEVVEVPKPLDISPVMLSVSTASVSVSKTVVVPRVDPVIAPDQVRTELKKVMEMQKQRQKELGVQMQTLRITLGRAKTYNKILNNMYPTLPGGSVTARAVNQEKIRLIHEEVKKMAPALPISPALRSAQIASRQASQARSSAFVLPIGKHAPRPKAPVKQAQTSGPSSEQE